MVWHPLSFYQGMSTNRSCGSSYTNCHCFLSTSCNRSTKGITAMQHQYPELEIFRAALGRGNRAYEGSAYKRIYGTLDGKHEVPIRRRTTSYRSIDCHSSLFLTHSASDVRLEM